MTQDRPFHIRLVPWETWRYFTRTRFRTLTAKSRRAAHSILRMLHNRHIGITPADAAQLAALVTEPAAAPHAETPWRQVLDRLMEEVDMKGFGMLPSAAPPYSVLRLAMPIVETACRNIGMCFLFCDDNDGSVGEEDYRQYTRLLTTEIRRMAEDRSDSLATFWKERAFTLASYSRRPDTWVRQGGGIPETDPAAAALLFRLTPQVPPISPRSRTPKPVKSPLKHRESPKHREGGFSGIRMTRQPEDMEDILISEFLNPPLLLADRLVNSGYLALKRKPRQEKLKDVLVAALVPRQVNEQLSGDFIKAAWFDFIARLGLLLGRHKLLQSQFRWLEGDSLEQCRACTFHLEDLPMPGLHRETEPSPAFRRGFLAALGWLPTFLDQRSTYRPVTLPREGEIHPDPAVQWALSAWKDQSARRHSPIPGQAPPTGFQEGKIRLDEYAFVHIMLFLPAQDSNNGEIPPRAKLAQLQRGLGISSAPGRSVVVTRVPTEPDKLEQWAVERPGAGHPKLFLPQQRLAWQEIAGKLEQAWLQHIIEEIWHG